MTPRRAIVPVDLTQAMDDAHYDAHATAGTVFASAPEVWSRMLAASPSSGRVSAADLERAAEAVHRHSASGRAWSHMDEFRRAIYRGYVRAALTALGLAVEEEAPASAGAGKLKGTRG